ncbi:MAG: hypothetical protein E5X85_20855, partial [Mesorhizobium sp.]
DRYSDGEKDALADAFADFRICQKEWRRCDLPLLPRHYTVTIRGESGGSRMRGAAQTPASLASGFCSAD